MTIIKATKLPVTIDAVQWLGDNAEEVSSFMFSAGWTDKEKKEVYIPTPEGTMVAKVGDYIIRGVSGEYYPCKPDIFEATYSIEPDTFLDRMKNEYKDLEIKINKAASFIESGLAGKLPMTDSLFLHVQVEHMRRYAEVLGKRILLIEERDNQGK